MKKIFLVLLLICLWMPIGVFAADCTDSQINRFKKLANEIQTTFDYEEQNGNVSFNINFHNVDKDLYIVDYDTFDLTVIYDSNNSGIIIAPNYEAGKSFTFSVLNNKKVCTASIVTRITVTTPNFNKYYNDPLCSGIETYSLCQKWNNIGNIDYQTFKRKVEDYKHQQEKEEPVIDNEIENNFWNRFRNFIARYYPYMTASAFLIFIVGLIIYKQRKKDEW